MGISYDSELSGLYINSLPLPEALPAVLGRFGTWWPGWLRIIPTSDYICNMAEAFLKYIHCRQDNRVIYSLVRVGDKKAKTLIEFSPGQLIFANKIGADR